MEKFFWFSLPVTLMIAYLVLRAMMGRPVSRRDINMLSAIYLIFYLIITACLGLFWVARMDLPAFDLHYLFGYCLMFLVSVHLWFQLPIVFLWLRKNSPSYLLVPDKDGWKPLVKYIFLTLISLLGFSIATLIVYEFINPATSNNIESMPEIVSNNRVLLSYQGEKMHAARFIQLRGDLTRSGVMRPWFNIAKPDQYKSYPNSPVINLPTPSRLSGISLSQGLKLNSAAFTSMINLQHLSNLLFYTDGVTNTLNYPGGYLKLRAAASAGALYPNDLYLAAISIKGLAAGIYYYHPADHALIKVGGKELLSMLALASPYPHLLENASAVIIMTALFDRSVWKYHERSYRYVLPDAGHILANLSLVAASMKLPYRNTEIFDDEAVKKILRLSPLKEGVISMMVISKQKWDAPTQMPAFSMRKAPKNLNDMEISRLAQQLTAVKWTSGMLKLAKPKPEKVDQGIPASTALIQLPVASSANGDIFSLIKHRRSFRQFSNHELSFEDFSGIIQQAYLPLTNHHLVEPGRRVELYVVATRVRGLLSGVYQYLPEQSALLKINIGNFSTPIYQAGLSQEVLERAAFVIVWVIDFNRIGRLHGERDYRYANLECGIGSETAYLAAQARHVGACAVGAFFDEEVRQILKINTTNKYPILFTAVGQK